VEHQDLPAPKDLLALLALKAPKETKGLRDLLADLDLLADPDPPALRVLQAGRPQEELEPQFGVIQMTEVVLAAEPGVLISQLLFTLPSVSTTT